METPSDPVVAENVSAEINRRARETALEVAAGVPVEPTSQVTFLSRGRLLIIGEAAESSGLATELRDSGLDLFILTLDGDPPLVADPSVYCLTASGRGIRVEGHFGEFSVVIEGEEGDIDVASAISRDGEHFDLIVDFQVPPHLTVAVPPLGYYPAGGTADARERLVQELPEMVGEFEKARYFSYDPDICAHGNSGLQACRRCLEACPAGAITSLVEKIEVDPFLCQGGGICATACPTGAIIYSFPKPKDLQNRLRTLLRTYRDQGGQAATLVFHGGGGLSSAPEELPGHFIPIELEEVGSIGIEVWLTALAYGAERVVLWTDADLPDAAGGEMDLQIGVAHALLAGLGYPESALLRVLADSEQLLWQRLASSPGMPMFKAATFAGSNHKRDTLFYALDHLVSQSDSGVETIALPAASPLGEVLLDREACTLCMACVSVCPAGALSDGADQPLLGFIERNCVQCGLCETACPEAAIKLNARLLLDREQGLGSRVLNQEPAFCCVACGKPFATLSVIAKMKEKLAGHAMFRGEAALRRLEMCEDCRVRDMFTKDESLLQ